MRQTLHGTLRSVSTASSAAAKQAGAALQRLLHRIRRALGELWKDVLYFQDLGYTGAEDRDEQMMLASLDLLRARLGDNPVTALMRMKPALRKNHIRQLVQDLAGAFDIPMPNLQWQSGEDGTCGGYLQESNVLRITEQLVEAQLLSTEEARELIWTLCHEMYHAYQSRAWYSPTRYGISKQVAALWRINARNYIDPSQNRKAYAEQPLEISATLFANHVVWRMTS